MSSIQEIHALGKQIYNCVEEYQKGNYSDNDVLAISSNNGEISVDVDSPENIVNRDNTELYSFSSLLRDDENGGYEPDNDKIDDLANNWLFLD